MHTRTNIYTCTYNVYIQMYVYVFIYIKIHSNILAYKHISMIIAHIIVNDEEVYACMCAYYMRVDKLLKFVFMCEDRDELNRGSNI